MDQIMLFDKPIYAWQLWIKWFACCLWAAPFTSISPMVIMMGTIYTVPALEYAYSLASFCPHYMKINYQVILFAMESTSHTAVEIILKDTGKYDDVIKWKHFPRYWPFVWGIHRSPVNSLHNRPVTRSFDIFFDLRLNKRLSKQSWGWWFETLPCPFWCHCNA